MLDKIKTICIDPGHGGYDPGACGNGLREADLTMAISLEVSRILGVNGITAIMTRTKDVSPSGDSNLGHELQARCDIANRAKVDFFLSVHINAGGGHGAEILVHNMNSQAVPVATRIVNRVGSLMGLHGEPVKVSDRNLYVLRATNMPAALVEVGFIDSAGDAAKIKANVRLIARLIAEGILNKSLVPQNAAPAPAHTTESVHTCKVKINGQQLPLPGYLRGGKSYLPVRLIGGLSGAGVGWDDKAHRASLDGKVLEDTILIESTGYAWTWDIAQVLGFKIGWDADTGTVLLTKGGC
ncbi:N-acetylmuramoyl-L-alanine amidase [Aneurinibacillus sp. Ricciae_BoGa-3]|uniref:N-acetylmuramoyl-L-alanine amidase n=1 Tax=Aneurinibacillus sp. Ricciae_BoGa-3 TaxID=3022697 RepID=UPI0023402787|nr:N-acetylmuramoyl-L-alanine amidase [Aneurinibacillus sp. Ricciae_BoGa-3]WCK53823.1 N-acetylmuramoyl-L-alanine amidase [Aneurinibacillus sp. Ricciae_BoGa-3]